MERLAPCLRLSIFFPNRPCQFVDGCAIQRRRKRLGDDGMQIAPTVPSNDRAAIRSMSNAKFFVSMLLTGLCVHAHATSGSTKALEGTWCSHDAGQGETIVQYSARDSEVTAFTVLSEADPRRIGSQASIQLTAEAPNVFVRRALVGADEEFNVQSEQLTVNSLWISNRGTSKETRQVLASQTFYKCDVGQALRRAQAFMSSPRAEQATRMALLREEQVKFENTRKASKDAYYAGLIRQLKLSPRL
jgi:hypothetical protein